MVCDQLFDPDECRFNWPAQYPKPAKIGLAHLPIVAPAPRARRDVVLPPPTRLELPGKGAVPAPTGTKKVIQTGVPAGGAGLGATLWDWIAANPYEAAAIGLIGGGVIIGGGVYLMNRWHRSRQEAPTPALVPVFAPSSTVEPVAA
jgi:hypothetical protein